MIRAFLSLLIVSHIQAQTGNLRVAVIAVGEFEKAEKKDDDLNLDGFKDSLQSAVGQIRDFFKKNYGVEATVLQGKANTTKSAIQTYLNTDYVSTNRPTVNLVFVLSHGFGHQFTNGGSELFIATSETSKATFLGKGLEGTELVRKLARIPERSSVFLFLDTCQSAAIDFASLDKLLTNEFAGRRFMVMAAADRGSRAFNFNFSRALVDLWNSTNEEDCDKSQSPDEINEKVQQFLERQRGTAREQHTQIVFPFDGEFCIDSFGRDRALVMLYNPSEQPIRFGYREKLATRPPRMKTVLSKRIYPLSLKPVDYVITITEQPVSAPAKERSIDLNLAVNRVEFRPLADTGTTSAAARSLGTAQMEAAAIAARWGADENDVWQLGAVGQVTMSRAGLNTSVPDAVKQYLRTYSADENSSILAVNYAALGDVAAPVRYEYLKSKIVAHSANPYSIAVMLGQSGDHETANHLCLDWFSTLAMGSGDLARCAIYNSLATGASHRVNRTTRFLATHNKRGEPLPAITIDGQLIKALNFRFSEQYKFDGLVGLHGLVAALPDQDPMLYAPPVQPKKR